MWPMFFAGAGITWAYRWFRMKAVDKFKDPTIDRSKLKKIHRFSSVEEVSLLCRAMRQFDLDGVIDSDAADLGELVIKVRRCSNSYSRRLCVCACVHSCRPTQTVRMPCAGHVAESFSEMQCAASRSGVCSRTPHGCWSDAELALCRLASLRTPTAPSCSSCSPTS